MFSVEASSRSHQGPFEDPFRPSSFCLTRRFGICKWSIAVMPPRGYLDPRFVDPLRKGSWAREDKCVHQLPIFTSDVDGYKRNCTDPANASMSRLTVREREVVQLITEGKVSKEFAVILKVSLATAETHRSNILRKLRLHCTADLVLYAVRNGIVHLYLAPILGFKPGRGTKIARARHPAHCALKPRRKWPNARCILKEGSWPKGRSGFDSVRRCDRAIEVQIEPFRNPQT